MREDTSIRYLFNSENKREEVLVEGRQGIRDILKKKYCTWLDERREEIFIEKKYEFNLPLY